MIRIQSHRTMLAVLLCTGIAPSAFAQYVSDFDSLAGSAAGTVLTGQDGYFLPNGSPTDIDFNVFTYAGNALGLPQNPTGGTQFIAGTGSGTNFARAQRLNGMSTTGEWTYAFDIAGTFTGTLPSAQNLGSVSLNEGVPGLFSVINLATWVDPNTATDWNANFIWFDAAGTQVQEVVGEPNFQNLPVNHWYRWSTTIDLDSNRVLEVQLTDLTTNITTINNPVDRYLRGGSAGNPNPDHIRFFGGGGVAGNTLAFDNASVVPEPASLAALGLGALALLRKRRSV